MLQASGETCGDVRGKPGDPRASPWNLDAQVPNIVRRTQDLPNYHVTVHFASFVASGFEQFRAIQSIFWMVFSVVASAGKLRRTDPRNTEERGIW